MVYDSLRVRFDFEAAFGQVNITYDLRQAISAAFLGHIPELHSRYVSVTLRPIKLLYSFLESLHNEWICCFDGAKLSIYFVNPTKTESFLLFYAKNGSKYGACICFVSNG